MSQDKKPDILTMARKKRHIHLLNKLQREKSLSPGEIRELEQFEGSPLPPGCVRTQEEVAKALHVSVRSVQHWVRDGMPRGPEGYYDLIDIQTWRATKNRKDKNSDEEDKIKWEVRHREYRARLTELELKKAYGLVLNKEEVEAGRVARILTVKRALLLLGKTVAPVIVGMEPREIQAYIDERVKEIIRQFAGQEVISENKN